MGVIFYFSHQPGNVSGELSGGVIQTLETLLRIDLEPYHILIRKTAHLSVYLILGVFTLNTLLNFKCPHTHALYIAIIICLIYAISDEFHQTFIPGRSGEIWDVFIDTLGASIGVLLMNYLKPNYQFI